MQLSDLIDQTRKQAADAIATPQLWSDADITFYLNDALRDACIRGKLIRDQLTDADKDGTPVTLLNITACPVTPQTPTGFNFSYDLHPSIFQIDSAVYVDTQLPILELPKDMYLKDRWHYRYGYGYATPGIFGDYNTASAARATGFWPDTQPAGALIMRLLPLPNANTYVDTNGITQPIQLRLCVYRTPLYDMEASTDVPEIHERWHLKLIDGACARMFMRGDPDIYDLRQAERFEERFTASFGTSVSANTLRQRHEYRRQRTRFRFP